MNIQNIVDDAIENEIEKDLEVMDMDSKELAEHLIGKIDWLESFPKEDLAQMVEDFFERNCE